MVRENFFPADASACLGRYRALRNGARRGEVMKSSVFVLRGVVVAALLSLAMVLGIVPQAMADGETIDSAGTAVGQVDAEAGTYSARGLVASK